MLENNLLWVDTLPSRHTVCHCHPHSSGGIAWPTQQCWVLIPLWNLGRSRLALLGLYTLGLWWEWYHWWSLNHLQGHSSLFLKDKACLQPNCSVLLSYSLWPKLTVSLRLGSKLYSWLLLKWLVNIMGNLLKEWLSGHILGVLSRRSFLIFCHVGKLRICQIFKFWFLFAYQCFLEFISLPLHFTISSQEDPRHFNNFT